MTPDRAELRRLHFINALFAHITGQDLYLAEQIKAAISFSLAELETQTAAHPEYAAKFDRDFNAAAARLLAQSFARDEIMTGLKQLATHSEATLLVTNLRPALIPPPKRAVGRRLQEYEDTLSFIRDLAAARTSPSANLQLLFL
jgi:hypothetical protein